MLNKIKLATVAFILSVSFLYGNFLNENVYSKDNEYRSDEFINVTVYERINPAIVLVEAQLIDGLSSGTGCIINKSGIILTSSHVVHDANYIEVTTSKGETYKAELIKQEGNKGDLALLRINPKNALPVIKLGDSSLVKVGQKVLAIGNPFGFNGTLTTGIVSRIDYERNKIQTDAAINPGSSGGPILNAKGEVIGISQSIYNPDNNKSNIGIGFAVPANEVKKLVSSYMN
ncbi:MAG: trypsin-like peptidase domain-containing protein [Candidatus Gastranaerophilales bacterium]|nr:trypsin-like peptidase domain-containing protein [Candidatus Gastranaerophilales bacterium]